MVSDFQAQENNTVHNEGRGSHAFRPAREADLEAISALLVRTWQATYTDILGVDVVHAVTSTWHTPAALAAGLSRPDEVFLVAVAEQARTDTAAAHSVLGTASAKLGVDGVVNLMRLYIDPEAQGQGTGTQLLKAVLAPFDGKATSVMLEVEPQNTGAIAFYERHGFTATGSGTDCGGFGAALAHTIMSRPLPL